MVTHHLSYTVVHPYSSHWYTWFLPVKPIYLRRDVDVDGSIRALLTLGNPLLWWGGIAAVIGAAVIVVRTGPARVWRKLRDLNTPEPLGGSLEERTGHLFWLVAAWSAPIVFWIPSLRDSFIYHYMPSYAFALVLLAGLVERTYRRYRMATLIGVIVVLEVSLFYAPLWGELPITQRALDARLPFRSWR
jgi:dolichyl-phosphate-mannose--protein O-mannosyl transferase